MTATASKVDAIQAQVLKATKEAIKFYIEHNLPPKGEKPNKPPREFIEKIIRNRLDSSGLVEAFVEDALAGIE